MSRPSLRIGQGWDLHRLVQGRPLLLGGITIPSPLGEEAHSDGDVLLHAIIDALLGALGEGDIGSHFPPSDPRWKDISSLRLLHIVKKIVHSRGYRILNMDTTIILESPKLKENKDLIRRTLSAELGIPKESITVKGKTKEKVDAVGRGEAIEALAVVLLAPEEISDSGEMWL